MRKSVIGITAVLGGVLTLLSQTIAAGAATAPTPVYNSVVAPASTGNLPSVGGEAYAFNEIGNEVQLTSNATRLVKVTVELSTWGCVSGHWYSGDCSTPAGSTFSEPITLNIYQGPADPNSGLPGALLTRVTKTFNIPYRPSANYTHCTSADGNAGKWWDKALSKCFNGKAVLVSFGLSVNLPTTDIVYGIAYNTTHYGYNPIGESAPCYTSAGGCGYDSLNVALSNDDPGQPDNNVTVGSDPNPGTIFVNYVNGSSYCDGGAAGSGTFRMDSPPASTYNNCWSESGSGAPYYVPAIQFSEKTV